MVGPTAAELESLKELIQFDHEYIKPVQVNFVPANTKAVAAPTKSVVKCNKPKKMVSVINVGVSNDQTEPVNSISQQTVTPAQDVSLDLPEFFESDILNFNTDLIKDLDLDKLLTGGIIDNEIPAEVSKPPLQQQQQPISCSISQDNPRKRKCSDVTDSSTAKCSKPIMQSATDDFCFQTVVKFDDIFTHSDNVIQQSESVSELSEAGSPASVVSSSSSSHDDLWEESFSELFPTLI